MLPYKNQIPIDKNRVIMHIDFNSYFATVEQQANPRLRGKPIGVTGGDRMSRTVLGAASVEAKKFGIKTGMRIPEALRLCPQLILVRGDSDKYLECTKRFLNILKDYSDKLEVFSIDEVFLEFRRPENQKTQIHQNIRLPEYQKFRDSDSSDPPILQSSESSDSSDLSDTLSNSDLSEYIPIADEIKQRIRAEVGEWITCSIGISYNKLLAKFAGSLYKPDGLVVIEDDKSAMQLLDLVELDQVCGIGHRIKKRLFDMGVTSFAHLRKLSLDQLRASFKSYGVILYGWARGIDHSPVQPFFEKEEVKSVGHRHTISRDTLDEIEIKQLFVKLSEMVARRLRSKNLVGKTITVWYRAAFNLNFFETTGQMFEGGGMQKSVLPTQDGLEIFKVGWEVFHTIWKQERIRMVGISVSNLRPKIPENLSLLEEVRRNQIITRAIDAINDRYGEFTLSRGILLNTSKMRRMPNPFLSDRRFKI